ncbi:dynactin subunit 2-like isoform X1 [Anser cygnoides]|uniref:dynactin subunit 2-like isoform X1 n=1 Tax=Anser cygnoides TaxID=8845 RepID=UPI002009A2C0|nr:dynactin subunit 2-like isoform X1 [Anser cygnoides]
MRRCICTTRPRFILKLVQEVISMSSSRLRLRSVSWWWSSGVVGMKAEALLECRVNSVMLQQQLLNSAMLHLAVTGTTFVVRLCPSLWSPVWTHSREEWLPAAAAEELAKCRTEAPVKSPAKALTSIGDMVTFEVYWRPGQDQFALDAKIVELEKRLAQLEATVQCKPISQNLLLVEPMGSSLLETAQILQAKVNILDEVMLDQIEARLKSILGKVKEIAEHEATLQCANSQSKIHQTYELMQHWDPIASSLPDVVQYLLTLRDLHKEATQVGQVLEDMETMQKEIADALQVNTFLLEVVQKTMKEFLAFVEENVAETEASIRKLQK